LANSRLFIDGIVSLALAMSAKTALSTDPTIQDIGDCVAMPHNPIADFP